MTLTNNTSTGNISFSQPQQTNHDPILPGQIWQEGRDRSKTIGHSPHRVVLVLEVNEVKVVIQNILTGKKTKVLRHKFNRGTTGYHFVASLSDVNGLLIKHSKNLHEILRRTILAISI